MMQRKLIALALVAAFAAPAFAEEAAAPASPLSFNVGVVTDYVFRGISQSQHQPALQGGVDYAHSSGLYVGAWVSTVKWVKALGIQKDNKTELDLYGGYKGAVGDFTYDVGALRYIYDGAFQPANSAVTANTTEVYVAGGWKFVTLKYNHVVSQNIFAWGGVDSETKSKGSGYTDLTVTYPVNETVNVIAHVGRQNIKNNSSASYTDWKLGVTKDLGFGVVGVAYTDTNAKGGENEAYHWAGKDTGKGVLAASFVKTF